MKESVSEWSLSLPFITYDVCNHTNLSQDKSSSRQKDDSGPEPPKSDNIKDWTQQELDSFISKNDWGSVAKYINEMRQNKGNTDEQAADPKKTPSAREIQEQIDYNQKLQQQGGKSTPSKPRRSSSAQDDDTSHSEYTPSATQASESVWDSVSSDSYSEESSQYYKSKRGSASKRRAKEVMM